MQDDVKLPGYITSLLAVFGSVISGFLISKGWFTSDQLATLGGGAMVVVIAVWRMYAKRKNREALLDAIDAPAGKAKP